MAVIDIYGSINMLDAAVWYGSVLEHTASDIIISNGVNETVYYGSFSYDAYGTVSGTLTGITEINNGAYQYVATGLNVPATEAESYIQSGNAQGFLATALAGNDQFVIEAPGTHVINGYAGYNVVYELGASTSYVFGSTAGSGVAGVEVFSLYNTQAVVFSDGVINLVNGLFYPNGGEPNQIILQNTSGQLAMWQMSGATIIDAGSVGNPGPTWHVEGTGHFFFGDGNTDVLWQNDDGTVYVWSVDGMDARTGSVIANPGPTWHVKGDGHFFGTVYSDVLLQNDDGSVAVWGMSGPTINDAGLLGNPGPTWHVKGTGDFFGSDSSGIVMQNDDGSVALWDVSGTRIINAGLLNGPEPAWHVKGTGDFFGDSNTDVVMQNDDGSVVLWDVSGTKIVNAGLVGDPGPAWHVKGTGDYFGDGHADLVMQNDDGSVVVWDMSGAHIINAGLVGNPGASWGVYDDNMQFIYSVAANETLAATPATPDEFVFTNFAAGAHTISGFNPVQDMIELSKTLFASFADVQAATSVISGVTTISLGRNGSLLLPGVAPGSLHASDFAFT